MFIANWKMNGSQSMLVQWLEGINKTLDESLQTKCILCPPVCFLSEASKIIKREKLSIKNESNLKSLNVEEFEPLAVGDELPNYTLINQENEKRIVKKWCRYSYSLFSRENSH